MASYSIETASIFSPRKLIAWQGCTRSGTQANGKMASACQSSNDAPVRLLLMQAESDNSTSSAC
eukprot:scaffold657436_cov59-Prasinocladus_malaysianus.AAC.1